MERLKVGSENEQLARIYAIGNIILDSGKSIEEIKKSTNDDTKHISAIDAATGYLYVMTTDPVSGNCKKLGPVQYKDSKGKFHNITRKFNFWKLTQIKGGLYSPYGHDSQKEVKEKYAIYTKKQLTGPIAVIQCGR